ncbi:MAG TPA: hypothetical protein P5136_02360 [Methanofastidiosum sp.]|nr:hypothetical protein [Methanofastidiosum sp.]
MKHYARINETDFIIGTLAVPDGFPLTPNDKFFMETSETIPIILELEDENKALRLKWIDGNIVVSSTGHIMTEEEILTYSASMHERDTDMAELDALYMSSIDYLIEYVGDQNDAPDELKTMKARKKILKDKWKNK